MSLDEKKNRPIVLVICDYYLPGFESGGAVRTLANMVDRLGNRFDFRVITRDHDGTAVRTSYTTVNIGEWNTVGNAQVYYLHKDQVRANVIRSLIRSVSPDVIYLNSFFSRLTIFCLSLFKFRQVRDIPLVLAPEGEFSIGALAINSLKKKLYIPSARALLLDRKIVWKAASDAERKDIERVLGTGLNIHTAPNMPPKMIFPEYDRAAKPAKTVGSARMIFLSRLMRKKNLNWLLEKLSGINGDLRIDVFGTLEESDYWEDFKRIVASLPANIQVESKGPITHDRVSQTLFEYDFFVLPTLGENFGHVFIEALASGCPLIVSDRTPWRNLERSAIGWDLPLEAPNSWVTIVQNCVDMKESEYQKMSARARDFAVEWLSNPDIEISNVKTISSALRQKSR